VLGVEQGVVIEHVRFDDEWRRDRCGGSVAASRSTPVRALSAALRGL
jgi:hypothetical protein